MVGIGTLWLFEFGLSQNYRDVGNHKPQCFDFLIERKLIYVYILNTSVCFYTHDPVKKIQDRITQNLKARLRHAEKKPTGPK